MEVPIITESDSFLGVDAPWCRINGMGTSNGQYLKDLGEILVFKIGLPQKELHLYPLVITENEESLLAEQWSKEG